MILQKIPRTRNRNKKKPKLSKEETIKLRRKKSLHKKILNIFKNMGFEYIHSDGIHKIFQFQKGEADNIFLYENIIVIVEETISENDTDHIRKKYEYYQRILNDSRKFIEWIKNDFSEIVNKYDDYGYDNYKIHYLYTTENSVSLETSERFHPMLFLGGATLEYFRLISKTIKFSSRVELFKFLSLDHSDIGHSSSSVSTRSIETTIIIPESGSGFPEGIQVLTFVMQADDLLDCAYVLRKDSWDQSIGLYQRLIQKNRIESIRNFLVQKRRTFIDSIIVSLPDEVKFFKVEENSATSQIDIFKNTEFLNIRMSIPHKINSIGIIDGQHRVFFSL